MLIVGITFDGDSDGTTEIDLPSKWAGSEGLEKHLYDFIVIGGTLIGNKDPSRRTVRHQPGARLTVRYRVLDGQPGLPDARTFEKAQPIVEADWFYLHAEGVFAIPVDRENAPARFHWGHRPKGWRLASDLDVTDSISLTVNQVASAVLIGGKSLRLTKRQVGGQPVMLAALGQWTFSDAMLYDRIATLISVENAMLSAPAKPFLVTLAPLTGSEKGSFSYGGTGRTSGFALTSTDNIPLNDFTRLLAHEYAHRWFGQSFGPYADGATDYWFTEGFTDWFANQAMVKSDLWTISDWRASINELLFRYAGSTARNLTDAELSTQFWTNPDAMQVQYDRGHLTAMLLDTQLKSRKSGLLKSLRHMADTSANAREDEVSRLDRLTGANLVTVSREAANRPLPVSLFGPCGSLHTVTQPIYDRGFTMTPNKVVDTVPKTSPAWIAGLRPGFRFVKRTSISIGDASKPYVAEFLDGSFPRLLSWLPEGNTSLVFQQLVRTEGDNSACQAYFDDAHELR